MGGVIFFLVNFFFTRGGFQFVFIKAYTTFAISGVRRGLGDKGGILGIFFPCIGINRKNKHSGSSAFGFLYSEYCSNHESAGGWGRFFSCVLNLKRFVSNKCGWAKGRGGGRGEGAGLGFMHSVYDCTMQHIYIGLPAASCSYFSCLLWVYVSGGCSNRRSFQGLFWQNTAYVGLTLRMYLHTSDIQSDTHSTPLLSPLPLWNK